MRIVDDDVDLSQIATGNLENPLEEDVGDNDPTVADFIDERPDAVKQLEAYRQDKRWKVVDKGTVLYKHYNHANCKEKLVLNQ